MYLCVVEQVLIDIAAMFPVKTLLFIMIAYQPIPAEQHAGQSEICRNMNASSVVHTAEAVNIIAGHSFTDYQNNKDMTLVTPHLYYCQSEGRK